MYRRYSKWLVVVLFLLLQACGSGNSDSTLLSGQSGAVDVSLTDAPAFGMDHVWITVRDLWFHTSDSAEPGQRGWIKFPLSAPVTLDLLKLGNGEISVPVWDNIEVPEGDYTQIRVFLVRTEAALTDSAKAENPSLTYNNQVDVGSSVYPLRVPDPDRGIKMTGRFSVKKNQKLKIAIDFDAGHDVVQIEHDTEYILKPRLAYFDLQNAGAIVGSIDSGATGSNPSAQFVIKAEQLDPNGLVHRVHRATVLSPDNSGNFVLFPLHPGNYDVVIRGLNYQTVIIRNVPVTRGTKPLLNPTIIPKVTMTPSTNPDHPLDVTIVSPTGAWVDFFQTLPDESAPYEIRFRHFNPLTGRIIGFPLSSDPLRVGTYVDNTTLDLQPTLPVGGMGNYIAVAGAPLHTRELSEDFVTSGTTTLEFTTLSVIAPVVDRTVTGTITVPDTMTGFDKGVLFACHGGMIVNAIPVDDLMVSGGTYTISNLPGGTALPGAFYGIEAFGWSTGSFKRAIAAPQFVNLTYKNAAGVDLTMEELPLP